MIHLMIDHKSKCGSYEGGTSAYKAHVTCSKCQGKVTAKRNYRKAK